MSSKDDPFKMFLRLLYSFAALAALVAIQASDYYYRHARWRSLTLEIAKIGLLVLAFLLSRSRRFSRDTTVPSLISLRLGTLTLFVSALSDMQVIFS